MYKNNNKMLDPKNKSTKKGKQPQILVKNSRNIINKV